MALSDLRPCFEPAEGPSHLPADVRAQWLRLHQEYKARLNKARTDYAADQDQVLLDCLPFLPPALTHRLFDVKRLQQGLPVVMYGASFMESWTGLRFGFALPNAAEIGDVWANHFAAASAAVFGIAGVLSFMPVCYYLECVCLLPGGSMQSRVQASQHLQSQISCSTPCLSEGTLLKPAVIQCR